MLQLTDTCTIWRFGPRPGGVAGQQREQAVRTNVPCLVVPISQADAVAGYSRNSSHKAFLPRWVTDVRLEDELRLGRRTDRAGQPAQYRYVVSGIRRFLTFGLRHIEIFLQERE
jgi:hypothetical protein